MSLAGKMAPRKVADLTKRGQVFVLCLPKYFVDFLVSYGRGKDQNNGRTSYIMQPPKLNNKVSVYQHKIQC